MQLRSWISQKLSIPKSKDDSGVELAEIFKIGVRLLDIWEAHKGHMNILLINL